MVRKFKGKDGIEKIQVRLDLGILQMNATGRPDGKRPFGCESFLEFYKNKLAEHIIENHGDDDAFVLKPSDCEDLCAEARLYQHRSMCFFYLSEYQNVINDIEQNLATYDLIEQYAENEEFVNLVYQQIPHLFALKIHAQSLLYLQKGKKQQSIKCIENGLNELIEFYDKTNIEGPPEQSPEINFLKNWLNELRPKPRLTKREKLEKAMQEAIAKEEYEKAAIYRDQLQQLNRKKQSKQKQNINNH